MSENLRKKLANEVLNDSSDEIDSPEVDYSLLNNRRLSEDIWLIDEPIDSSKHLKNTFSLSNRDIYLWEIDNTIVTLENESDRLNKLEWFRDLKDLIKFHIITLEQKYEVIKSSSETEIKEERSSYPLEQELRGIIYQCWLRKR